MFGCKMAALSCRSALISKDRTKSRRFIPVHLHHGQEEYKLFAYINILAGKCSLETRNRATASSIGWCAPLKPGKVQTCPLEVDKSCARFTASSRERERSVLILNRFEVLDLCTVSDNGNCFEI